MEYVQILFDNISTENKELAIALLGDAGFQGFEEEGASLKAFSIADAFNERDFIEIINRLNLTCEKSIIQEINWNEKWESDFEPIGVMSHDGSSSFAYIRAEFHPADPAFLHDIIITPKMSFGTGHHATTYLMVSQMSALNFKNKSVIDFGTGTGILAILAEKMGAASVAAIDCDDWSINNARENLAINKCTRVNLVKEEKLPECIKADIILANINLNIIIANINAIRNSASPQADILLSGFLETDEAQILATIAGSGIALKKVYRRQNWIAIHVVNK